MEIASGVGLGGMARGVGGGFERFDADAAHRGDEGFVLAVAQRLALFAVGIEQCFDHAGHLGSGERRADDLAGLGGAGGGRAMSPGTTFSGSGGAWSASSPAGGGGSSRLGRATSTVPMSFSKRPRGGDLGGDARQRPRQFVGVW